MPRRALKPSMAEKVGAVALLLAVLMFFVKPWLAALPLAFFLLLCLGAPFLPEFGFFLPVISRAQPGERHIALTFDDGPSPLSTPVLLKLLSGHGLRATFFVVGEKAAAHPELIAAILAGGHTIGNHSLRHDPFLMLRTAQTLARDIHATQEIMKKQGITPLVFRPPMGITNPKLRRVVARENLLTITYSCKAFDGGNRNIRDLAGRILRRLRPGDIIMLHDSPPKRRQITPGYWQKELDRLFAALRGNYEVAPLEEVIRHSVMTAESR